jgi:hypothetical protein
LASDLCGQVSDPDRRAELRVRIAVALGRLAAVQKGTAELTLHQVRQLVPAGWEPGASPGGDAATLEAVMDLLYPDGGEET